METNLKGRMLWNTYGGKNVTVNKTLKPSAHQLSVVKVKNKALECIYSCVDNKSGIFLCYAMLFPDHTEYIVYHPSTM